MKRIAMFMFLFLSAFVISSFGSVRNADALGQYGCNNTVYGDTSHINCLRGILDRTAYGALQPLGGSGHKNYRCDASRSTNNRQNDTRMQRQQHVNCLRALLDQHNHNNPQTAAPMVAPTFDDGLMGGRSSRRP